jgi:histidine ammonia-lyase
VTVVLGNRWDFSLENFRRVAWEGEDVRFSDRAVEVMTAARRSFMALLDSDRCQFIYGVTTGFGDAARTILDLEGQKRQAKVPPYAKGQGLGPPLPDRVVRGMILSRLANFVEGYSAVSPGIALTIAEMLDGRPLPVVPESQVSAGEVPPLLNLFSHLVGEGCEEKDADCIENGSPCANALAADAALRARARLRLVHLVLGLSIEALDAPLSHYDPELKAAWNDAHEAAALDALNAVLEGARTEGRRSFQAPVSWRIIPRVLGQLERAVGALERVAASSLPAFTDNPIYIPPTEEHPLGRVFSTGGFHNGAVYQTLTSVTQAWADMCVLASRQSAALHDPSVSLLPRGLRDDDTSFSTGPLGQAAVHEIGEAYAAATPPHLPTSGGQTDVATPTFPAWTREVRAATALDRCLAVLAVSASQALWVTGRDPAAPLRPLLDFVRGRFAPVESLRDIGTECERLAQALGDTVLSGELGLR